MGVVVLLLGMPSVAGLLTASFAQAVPGIGGGIAALAVLFSLLMFWAAYRLQGELDEREEHTPSLEFGDPEEFSNEIIDGTPGKLWRVPLVNSKPNSRANNVKAWLYGAEPNLAVLPVSLHEMHDNTLPFRQQRNVRYGEPIVFDVVSEDLANDSVFYLFRSDGDLQTPDHMMSEDDGITVMAAAVTGGWGLTLRAVADPPTRGIEQRYVLFQSNTGPSGPVLSMKRDGKTTYV